MVSQVCQIKAWVAPEGPLEMRPVPILSHVYRMWPRYRPMEVLTIDTMEVFDFLHHVMLVSIARMASGVSAEML